MNALQPHASFVASGANHRPFPAGTHRRINEALEFSFIDETSPKDHSMAVRPFQGNGKQWLQHDALINLLLLIDLDLGESRRRFGIKGAPVLEMAHVIHVAHSNFNSPIVRHTLEKAGKDPELAAFVGLVHDYIEGMRSRAEKIGGLFNQETVFQNVCSLWPHKADHAIIRAVVLDHMTDANPKLSKAARIDTQSKKSIFPVPSLGLIDDEIVAVLNVETRKNDKKHNGMFDAFLRRCFVQARAEGKISNNAPLTEQCQWGLPDAYVGDAVEQMKMKRFALLRQGVEGEDVRRYDADWGYLKDQYVSCAVRQFISKTADAMMLRSPRPKLSGLRRAGAQIALAMRA